MKKRILALGRRLQRMGRPIPTLCYGLALAGWLAWCLFCLGSDLLGRSTGSLATRELTVQDFALVGLELQPDGTLYTLDGDPQMILEGLEGQAVRSLTIRAEYTKDAREMCLYYTTTPGAAFSQDQRVFAVETQEEGVYTYTLPRVGVSALRLDPCSPAENELLYMTVESITLNLPQSAVSYFLPGWHGAFLLVLWPGMTAALLRLGLELWRSVTRKKGLL